MGDVSWAARHSHAVTVHAVPNEPTRIYLCGGISETALSSNDVWRSIDLGRTWENVCESAEWAPRNYHQILSRPSRDSSHDILYIVAGLDGYTLRQDGNNTCFGDVWQSIDSGNSWEILADQERRRSVGRASIIEMKQKASPPIFGSRYAHSAFYVPSKDCLFVIGG